MRKIPVCLSGMKEAMHFVNIINKYDCNCDLYHGRCCVDAKSLIGVITIVEGSSNVELIIHSDQPDKLIENIKPYMSA